MIDQLNAVAKSSQKTFSPDNQQEFGFINRNFRVNALAVPVKSQRTRNISPDGLSTSHAKELINTICEYVNISPNLDYDNQANYLNETADYIKKIFKAQKDENNYNYYDSSTYITPNLEPAFLKNKEMTYNCNKIFEKSRVIHRQIISVEKSGLKRFLANIQLCDVTDFTPPEFNMLCHMNLPKDLKEKLEMTGGHPFKLTTSEYLDRLNRTLNGNICSAYDFDIKFASFTPKQKNIMGIFQEYKIFCENVPDVIIGEEEKNRKIIINMIKLIPYSLHPFLNTIQNCQKGNITLTAFENFLIMHEEYIDRFLRERNQRSTYKKQYVEKVTTDKGFSYLKDPFLQLDINGIQNDYCDNTETEKIERFEGVLKVKRGFKLPRCSICLCYGHVNKECIFVRKDEKRLQNQDKKNIKICLLCRSKGHRDNNCNIFIGLKPIPFPCKTCQKTNFFQFYHSSADCKRFNFLEKRKKESD